MALPAGRYGVTKNQLLKIKKLPMNTIKLIEELTEKYDLLGTAAFKNSTSVVTQSTDLIESGAVYTALQGKVDNTVIAPVENGTTVQKSGGYAAGSHAIRNGAFITWKNAKAQGETINDASDYTSGDVGSWLNPFKEISITPASGVTLQANNRLTSDGRICVLNLSTDAIDISADTNTTLLTVPSEYRPSGIAPLCTLMDYASGKLLLGFLQPSQGTFRVISNEALTGAILRGSLVWTL